MPTFAENVALSKDSAFLTKLRNALSKSALAVAGETPASPANTAVDDKRHALALQVLENREVFVERFADATTSGGTLTTASTDADVEFTVNAVWDDMAGVTGAEAA